jgi:alpha-amylase
VHALDVVVVVHLHQPVGEVDAVAEAAHRDIYAPLLDRLERHPRVPVTLHATGVVLDWLAAAHPETLTRLRALARRGQLALLGGGHYEPLLAALPETDRVGQILRLGDTVEGLTGRRPAAVWVAGGAWEPHLPASLAAAGATAAVVPAGLVPDAPGYYLTEDLGYAVALVPLTDLAADAARDDPPELLLGRLRTRAALPRRAPGPRLAALLVPAAALAAPAPSEGTREEAPAAWGDRLLALLAPAGSLVPTTLGEHLARAEPVGRVYAAPPPERSWRARLLRSRDANMLHKKMLRVSRKVAAAERVDADRAAAARDLLYRAQGADAYLGGAEPPAPHVRAAALASLVEAERRADAILARSRPSPLRAYPWGGEMRGDCALETADLDADGAAEVALDSPVATLLVAPARGGGVESLDIRAAGLPLLDTGRAAFLDHFLPAGVGLYTLAAAWAASPPPSARCAFAVLEPPPVAEGEIPSDPAPEPPRLRLTRRATLPGRDGRDVAVVVTKTLRHDGDLAAIAAAYEVRNDGEASLDALFAVEVAVNLPAPTAEDRYVRIPGVALSPSARRLGATASHDGLTEVELVDEWRRLVVRLEWDEPASLWRFPVDPTGARGTVLLLRWAISLRPGERFRVRVTLSGLSTV